MTTVNQIVRLETSVPPAELMAFRSAYPRIFEAMTANQTLINQLIIRVGGSGGGGSVVNLDEISARIEENAGQIAAVSAQSRLASGGDDAVADFVGRLARKVSPESAEIDHLMAMIGRIASAQGRIMQRIEELEALCLSSLAR